MKKIHSRIIAAIVAVLVLSLSVFALVACSSTQTIGTQQDGAVKISAKNETGQAITAVAVKSSLEQEYSEPLQQSEDWANDVSVELYLPQDVAEISAQEVTEGEDATVTSAEDVVLEPLTDILITTADGMNYEMHQLNAEDIKDATLYIEDGTAYLVYTSIASGEEVNTLETELAYQEQVKAAEEQAKAEAEAAQKAADEAAKRKTANSNKSGSKSGNQSNTPAPKTPSNNSASGGEDACVDDLILN